MVNLTIIWRRPLSEFVHQWVGRNFFVTKRYSTDGINDVFWKIKDIIPESIICRFLRKMQLFGCGLVYVVLGCVTFYFAACLILFTCCAVCSGCTVMCTVYCVLCIVYYTVLCCSVQLCCTASFYAVSCCVASGAIWCCISCCVGVLVLLLYK